jgi:hypothetical protein
MEPENPGRHVLAVASEQQQPRTTARLALPHSSEGGRATKRAKAIRSVLRGEDCAWLLPDIRSDANSVTANNARANTKAGLAAPDGCVPELL